MYFNTVNSEASRVKKTFQETFQHIIGESYQAVKLLGEQIKPSDTEMLMISLPEYDANWHQKCTFFPLALEDKTTDLDTEIFVLAVGNPIHYGVQVEFWSNLTIFRRDDPSKIDKFAIF